MGIFFLIYYIPYANAQSSTCSSVGGQLRTQNGLISTPQGNTFSTTSGVCVIDPKAAFLKIPSYDDLKSLYFDQSKTTKNTALTSISSTTTFSGDTVYYVNGDLTVSGTPTGSGTQVIFINGNLNISSNYTYGTPLTGTVFIVKGNVNISYTPLVTQVDAIIISSGTICTAYDGTSCPFSYVLTSQLVINGSLISLNPATQIQFRRTLSDNSQAAEKINHQVKYLVILRNLISDTLQRWSEIQ